MSNVIDFNTSKPIDFNDCTIEQHRLITVVHLQEMLADFEQVQEILEREERNRSRFIPTELRWYIAGVIVGMLIVGLV